MWINLRGCITFRPTGVLDWIDGCGKREKSVRCTGDALSAKRVVRRRRHRWCRWHPFVPQNRAASWPSSVFGYSLSTEFPNASYRFKRTFKSSRVQINSQIISNAVKMTLMKEDVLNAENDKNRPRDPIASSACRSVCSGVCCVIFVLFFLNSLNNRLNIQRLEDQLKTLQLNTQTNEEILQTQLQQLKTLLHEVRDISD